MSSTPSFYSSANNSTATLRPRAGRLISYLDDGDALQSGVGGSAASSSTSLPQRASRNPSPQAAGSKNLKTRRDELQSGMKDARSTSENVNRRSSSGIWDSWSSIQGIASTILGGDSAGVSTPRRSSSVKKHTRSSQEKVYTLKTQGEWGPKREIRTPTTSSIEEQRALLQARRRELLLLQSVEAQKDTSGRFKRKDSDASIHTHHATSSSEDDVLVYKHKVLPDDTMAGVVIKYNCQPEVFRKANRFWPNDNIQLRTDVILPVESCTVRGRKVDDMSAVELLQTEFTVKPNSNRPASASELVRDSMLSSSEAVPPLPVIPSVPLAAEDDYKHDSWVLLPNFTQPVEILRLSRRKLGYFPPAKRKPDTSPFLDSPVTTPRTSFDALRHPPTHAAQQAQLLQQQQQQQHSSVPSNSSPRPNLMTGPGRQRSSSTIVSRVGSGNAFMTALHGPGGVGTLRGLRTEAARPGPSDDPLNKKFAQYIPDLLPPDHDQNTLHPIHSRTNSSLRVTPRASTDSIRSTRSNSSTVPGALGGWMRKVAESGAAAATSPMRKRAGLHRTNSTDLFGQPTDEEVGDLIELDTTSRALTRQLHEQTEDGIPRSTIPAIITQQEEGLLNERFPIRGRVRRAYEAD